MNTIKLKQLSPLAKVPTQATNGSACFDLYAAESVWIGSGATAKIGTGWAFEIPAGFCVEIHSRSGLAANHGIRLANNVGIIDTAQGARAGCLEGGVMGCRAVLVAHSTLATRHLTEVSSAPEAIHEQIPVY